MIPRDLPYHKMIPRDLPYNKSMGTKTWYENYSELRYTIKIGYNFSPVGSNCCKQT